MSRWGSRRVGARGHASGASDGACESRRAAAVDPGAADRFAYPRGLVMGRAGFVGDGGGHMRPGEIC
jgi:hypothetical protein